MRALTLTFALSAAFAAPALAAGPFDGTWKAKPEAAKLDPKPQTFMIVNGTYSCKTCVPAYSVPADGAFHAIPGHPYVDEVSVQVVDPMTVVSSTRKGGKVTGKTTEMVSADGTKLTEDWQDMSAPNGQVITGKQTAMRVGPPMAGTHATSGSWRYAPPTDVSDAGLAFTLRTDGDKVHYEDPTGMSFDAVMGGPPVKVTGDLGGATVKIERLGPRSIRQTWYDGAKVTSVNVITVSEDGTMLNAQAHDLLHDTNSSYVAMRS